MKVDNLPELNETWLHGKYANGEINTSLSYVAVNDPDWFFQGDDGEQAIKEIHQYWLSNDVTQEDAFNWYVNTYLY